MSGSLCVCLQPRIKPWMLKSVQAAVSAREISPTQELNEFWNALPVEDVVELKHFIEHYAIAHGLP